MAQNVTVAGASYSDVPSVTLPKTGGGTASFTDVTATTAAAGDVASGKYFFSASGVLTLGTNQGGGVDAGQVYQDENGYVVLDDDAGGRYDTSDATATASDILATKTAYGASGKVTGNIATKTQSDLTASGATVTVPAGYYASQATKSVASGTAGTPTASKGTVSNHAVSVTPSVTNIAGYISGGTKTGTAVSVSASELVSGTKSISANGTGIDVTNYASVDVAVPGSTPTLITKSITQNGTYNASDDSADGYSSVTVNVSGGGGGSGSMSDPIRFFDYDGTLVASYSSVPSALPSVPTHDKLTNGAWNYTLAQITTQFNAMGTCDVGANYDTVSGATEIDIELQEGRLHPYLALAVNGTVTIDWGDNSTSTSTGTSLTTRKSDIHHEYAAAGSYTIKITKTSGTGYSLYCSSTYPLLNKNSSTSGANRVYSNRVQSVRVGDDCAIGNNAFYNCNSLASVSIPSGVTSIGSSAFYYCYSLASVSIPSDVTSIGGGSAFYGCYSLASVSMPSGVTSIDGSAFYQCYSLASVSIPSGVTSIGNSAFSSCYSLASVSIPNGVTSIGSNAFNSCYGMAEYHFKPTTPPTLANTNAFTSIQSDCVMYVPAASLDTYKTANSWSTYASYMVGE